MISALSDTFFDMFINGDFRNLIELLQCSPYFKLNLRGDHVIIYYRGEPIVEIYDNDSKNTICGIVFDAYLSAGEKIDTEFDGCLYGFDDERYSHLIGVTIPQEKCVSDLLRIIAASIDDARQFYPGSMIQQTRHQYDVLHCLLMENNIYSDFNPGDYFIVDVECTEPTTEKAKKTKALALHWPHNIKTDKDSPMRLAFIELKFGNESIESVEIPRIADIDFADIEKAVFQLYKLNLISVPGTDSFDIAIVDKKPFKIDYTKTQMIIAPVNCNQNKENLLNQVNNINVPDSIDFRIATSWPVGYGLYDKNMLTPDEFKKILVNNTNG